MPEPSKSQSRQSPSISRLEIIDKIDTVSGPLTLDGFDGWGYFHLQGHTVAKDWASHMHVIARVPKRGKAEFVIYSIWNGGNCCEPDYFLLDAGARPPRTLTITDWNTNEPTVIQYRPGSIVLRRLADTPTLHGDAIWETIRYQRGQEDFEVIRRSIVDNYKKFVGKLPSEFLSDSKARYSLVELLGVAAFGKFHAFDGAGEKLTLVAGRYLLGSFWGRGRYDPWQYRVFVIDIYLDRAWALQRDAEFESRDPGVFKAWGTLDDNDPVVRGLLDDWLRQFSKKITAKAGTIEIVEGPAPPQPPSLKPPLAHPTDRY